MSWRAGSMLGVQTFVMPCSSISIVTVVNDFALSRTRDKLSLMTLRQARIVNDQSGYSSSRSTGQEAGHDASTQTSCLLMSRSEAYPNVPEPRIVVRRTELVSTSTSNRVMNELPICRSNSVCAVRDCATLDSDMGSRHVW